MTEPINVYLLILLIRFLNFRIDPPYEVQIETIVSVLRKKNKI